VSEKCSEFRGKWKYTRDYSIHNSHTYTQTEQRPDMMLLLCKVTTRELYRIMNAAEIITRGT